MHILLIHQAFAAVNEPGGTRHHELARFFVSQGHRVTIIASPVSYLTGEASEGQITWVEQQEDGEQIRIYRTYTYPAFHKSFIHRVIGFFSFMLSSFTVGLRVKDVDVVWGTSPPIFQGVTAWMLARLKRVPFLFEIRDLWPAFAVAVGVLKQPVLIKMSEWLEKFLYRKADMLVANSPGFISHIDKRGGVEIKLVPNGADAKMFDPNNIGSTFRENHQLTDYFVILYAGAHGISNDLGVLIEAAERLKEYPDIAVVLLGAGKEKENLKNLAASKQLTNVHFLPPVPKSEMNDALAAADACVAILKPIEMYKTVYPNKVFDYMAAGRPVILAIDGVIKEVVDDAAAGISVKPGDPDALADAILKLRDDPVKGEEIGSNGRKAIEMKFDREILANDFLNLFEELSNLR